MTRGRPDREGGRHVSDQTGAVRTRRAFAVLAAVLAGGLVGASATSVTATTAPSPGAYGWGNNRSGEVGDGTTAPRNSPVPMVGFTDLATLAVGAVHGLALENDGSVLAWGHNRSGQLGNGSFVDSSSPVHVSGIGPVKTLSAGDVFSVAVQNDGAVFAWGNNNSGELGDGGTTKSSTPVHVSGLGPGSGVVAVAAGEAHALALKSDGTVLAWGNNQSGQLGDGTAPTDHHKPVQVAGLGPGSGIVKLAAGLTFALALKYGGTVLAWGNNARGELGNGDAPNDRATPVPVSGAAGAVDIAAGWEHGLALRADGSVVSWGDNSLGQLGDGTTANRDQPGPVNGFGPGSNVAAVFAAGDHAHAIVSVAPPPPPQSPAPPSGGSSSGGSGVPSAPTAHPVSGNPQTAG